MPDRPTPSQEERTPRRYTDELTIEALSSELQKAESRAQAAEAELEDHNQENAYLAKQIGWEDGHREPVSGDEVTPTSYALSLLACYGSRAERLEAELEEARRRQEWHRERADEFERANTTFKHLERELGYEKAAREQAETALRRAVGALETIRGPASDDDPFIEAYRAAGGGYEGLQAVARHALEELPTDS